MTDVATLGVTATETGVSKVDKALMGLAASAGKAEAATGRFSSAQIKYAQSAMAGWDGFNTVVAKQPALVKAAGVQMQNYGSHTANVFSQLNDIAVMLAAGQNPIQLAMQQGMQLNQVWGQMGGKVGAVGTVLRGAFMSLLNPLNLVTIGVIAGGAALVNYFTSGSEKAKEFKDVLETLTESTDALATATNMSIDQMVEKYGTLTQSIREAIIEQQRLMLLQVNDDADSAVSALKYEVDESIASIINLKAQIDTLRQQPIVDESRITDLTDAMNLLTGDLGLSADQAIRLNQAMESYQAAQGLRERAEAAGEITAAMRGTTLETSAFARAVNDSQLKLFAAAKAADTLKTKGPTAAWMNPSIGATNQLIARIDAAITRAEKLGKVMATATATTPGQGVVTAPGMIDLNQPTGGVGSINLDMGKGGGGSSGGGTDPYQSNLDALMKSLMTERETVEKWYADNEVILNDRRAMELLGASAHKEAMLDLERQYHEKLSKIKDDSDAYNLGSTAKLFGDLNTMAGGGYDGLLRAQKAFAAAEALVNTYRGAAQELARPTATPWQKFAAVAKVVAAGMGLVNAIKGGGKAGAGGSGGSSAQTTAASSQPVADRVTTVSFAGDPFMVAIAESVMKQMYDASGNGRVLIKA